MKVPSLRPTLQDPTTCQAPVPVRPDPRSTTHPHPKDKGARSVLVSLHEEPAPTNRCSTREQPPQDTRLCRGHLDTRSPPPPTRGRRTGTVPVLLRKEVIQPHLPVRLPCYDLVPIASPTFDGSSSCELGHRLRVLPTFVT